MGWNDAIEDEPDCDHAKGICVNTCDDTELPPDDVCCCGDMMKNHESALYCGHVPKSMLAYHLELEAEAKGPCKYLRLETDGQL